MKLKSKIKTVVFLLGSVACSLLAHAQSGFRYRAELPVTDSSGFYSVHLQPLLLAKSKGDLSDVRITTAGNKFVPYINGKELRKRTVNTFSVFPLVDYHSVRDTGTVCVIANEKRLTIDKVWLQLRNTEVVRTMSLSGSDNLTNWYAIKENVLLEAAGRDMQGKYEQILKFPHVNYRYIKILVNDRHKTPVQILRAGIYIAKTDHTGDLLYVKLPQADLVQKDSGTVSYITMKFKDAYPVDKLHLQLSGMKYFRRSVKVYQVNGGSSSLLTDTTISSPALNQDLFFSARTRILRLEVFNNDNAPLVVNAVTAYQSDQSIISYLEKGEHYRLLFGDVKALAPEYDIKFFTDSIRQISGDINTQRVSPNPLYTIKTAAVKSQIPVWAIWVAIGAVLTLLLIITFTLVSEVNKKAAGNKVDTDQ